MSAFETLVARECYSPDIHMRIGAQAVARTYDRYADGTLALALRALDASATQTLLAWAKAQHEQGQTIDDIGRALAYERRHLYVQPGE